MQQAVINVNVNNSGGKVVTRNSGPCPCCMAGCNRAQEPVPINGTNGANVERPVQIGQPAVPLTAPVVPMRVAATPPAVPLSDSFPQENCADFPGTGE